MNSDVRRVTMFFTAGLVVAAAVGFGVWRMGAPTSVKADPTMAAQSTTETSHHTNAEASHHSEAAEDRTGKSNTSASNSDASSPNPPSTHTDVSEFRDDPFLAPNSVINLYSQASNPTDVYRPETIFGEQTTAPEKASQTDTVPAGSRSDAPAPHAPEKESENQSLAPGSSNPNTNTNDASSTPTHSDPSGHNDDKGASVGTPSPTSPSEAPSDPAGSGKPSEPVVEPARPSAPEERESNSPSERETNTPSEKPQEPSDSPSISEPQPTR